MTCLTAPRRRGGRLACAVFGVTMAAWAGVLVPVPLRSAIVLRSAGYERNFTERTGDAVLAVVNGKSGGSAEDGRAVGAALAKLLSDAPVGGRKARVVQIQYESSAKTAAELRTRRAEIVYFAQGLEGIIKEIPQQEDGIRRILVCADGEGVGRGCTIGVELADSKPRLVLDLKQANEAGLRFQPEFLRLARIVR